MQVVTCSLLLLLLLLLSSVLVLLVFASFWQTLQRSGDHAAGELHCTNFSAVCRLYLATFYEDCVLVDVLGSMPGKTDQYLPPS